MDFSVSSSVPISLARVSSEFEFVFHQAPGVIVRAPGRVNLIGEHTDYNQGFVLPCAIDLRICIAAKVYSESEAQCQIYSSEYGQLLQLDLSEPQQADVHDWSNYIRGAISLWQESHGMLPSFQALIMSSLPQGAGLSSSAALLVALTTLFDSLSKTKLSPIEIALFAHRIETEFVGLRCGIMDQFASCLAQADHALLLDCQSHATNLIPLNFVENNLSIVITHSGVYRQLTGGSYNQRRDECQQAVARFRQLLNRPNLVELRNVSPREFVDNKHLLDTTLQKRCQHVFSENERVMTAVACLRANDLRTFGKLMNESHASLAKDYEVSCPELDELVRLTQAFPGALGSRLTGAGFGGCTVTLMESRAVSRFQQELVPAYKKQTDKNANVYVCSTADGAGIWSSRSPHFNTKSSSHELQSASRL